MADEKTRRPDAPESEEETGGVEAARNSRYAIGTTAGVAGEGPLAHRRHESSVPLERRAEEGPKPYTADTEAETDPSLRGPTDPAEREDARRRGPIA